MSTTSSSATTTLYVNGRPAQDELARLRAEVDKYKKQLMDIAADPSKGLGSTAWSNTLKKVKATEKELDKVQSNVSSVSQALARLDKATPKELRKALHQLNKELESIERGSKAWNEQVKKIRAVKDELAKVNGEIRVQESQWQRFNRIINEWQMTIMGAAAAVTGIVMAGKAAVQVYAGIDAEMASVRNFMPNPDSTMLKTTDAILRDLDDMVELPPNEVAAVMVARGYQIRYDGHSGRHGWAMKPRQR